MITVHPADQLTFTGGNAVFTVLASSSTTMSYQWRFNGTNIGGATASTLWVSNAQPAHMGKYSVVVANLSGSATSSNATLTVIAAPELSGGALTTNGFQCRVTVPAGLQCVLLASSNLIHWVPISTNVALTTTVEFTDPAATTNEFRLYRVYVK